MSVSSKLETWKPFEEKDGSVVNDSINNHDSMKQTNEQVKPQEFTRGKQDKQVKEEKEVKNVKANDKNVKEVVTKENPNSNSNSNTTQVKGYTGCQYSFVRGAKKGQQCGSKCIGDAKMCKKHTPLSDAEKQTKESKDQKKKLEKLEKPEDENGKTTETKIVKKTPKPTAKVIAKLVEKEKTAPCITRIIPKERIIVQNIHGNWQIPDTLLLVDGPKHMVFGKQIEDNICELSVEDIEYCKSQNFAYKLPADLKYEDEKNALHDTVEAEEQDEKTNLESEAEDEIDFEEDHDDE